MKRNPPKFEPVDGRPIWMKQPGESTQAYDCFHTYMLLPYGFMGWDGKLYAPEHRSMERAGKIHGKHRGTYEWWARRWGWTTRVDAYDLHLNEVEYEKRRAEHVRWVEEANDNLKRVRGDTAELYILMLRKMKEMLEAPLYIETDTVEESQEEDDEGVPIQVITRTIHRNVIPAGWNFNTLPRWGGFLLDLASVITDTGGTWEQVLKLVDYTQLTDAQLERVSTARTPEELIIAIIGDRST